MPRSTNQLQHQGGSSLYHEHRTAENTAGSVTLQKSINDKISTGTSGSTTASAQQTLMLGDDGATLRPLAVDATGHLNVNFTGEGALATEPKQDDMITLLEGQPPAGNRPKAIPVQIMVGDSGTQHSALRGVGGDLSVYIDDMNSDVAVNSGLSTATKQTDGSQKAQAWGTDGASQYQLKTDADGHLQVDVLTAPTTTVSGTVAVSSVAGTVSVDGSGVTQPISAASLPLPAGASTAANQATGNASLATIAGDTTSLDAKLPSQGQALMAASVPVAIASNQSTLSVDGSGVTQPVSAASLPLPAGAATETTLSTLNGKVTACNTGAVVVSSGAITETNSAAILADTASLDTKITQGNDSSLTNAQQVLVYGAGNGSLHPIKVTPSGVLKTEEVVTWSTTEIFNAQINFGQNATSSTLDLGTDIHVPDDVMFFVTNSASVDSEFAIEVSYNGTNWFEVNFLQANPQSNVDTMLSLINDFECAIIRYIRINIANGSADTNSTYTINASTYNG
jgi:hypothetical protein